jgi:hypothetical protein
MAKIQDGMRMPKAGATAAILAGVSVSIVGWIADARAAPTRLDCTLTDTDTKPASESRPIGVVFDEVNKTLTAEDGSHSYSFTKVSISNVSINGLADDISLGIDRSSLGIVWQQYGTDKVRTEYGHCHVARAPT